MARYKELEDGSVWDMFYNDLNRGDEVVTVSSRGMIYVNKVTDIREDPNGVKRVYIENYRCGKEPREVIKVIHERDYIKRKK